MAGQEVGPLSLETDLVVSGSFSVSQQLGFFDVCHDLVGDRCADTSTPESLWICAPLWSWCYSCDSGYESRPVQALVVQEVVYTASLCMKLLIKVICHEGAYVAAYRRKSAISTVFGANQSAHPNSYE